MSHTSHESSRRLDVHRIPLSAAALVLGASMQAPQTLAQAEIEPAANALEVVVVSARRRDESLQKVPLSVSALSATQIEARGITNLIELNTLLPNVVVAGKGPANGTQLGTFFVRGIGSSRDAIIDEPRVAIYVDGMYIGSADGALLDVVSVERVEVLRGPQGTLFGKNALAGAVNYVTKEPGEEFAGRAQVTIGRFDRLDVSATLDLPLGQHVFTRVAAASKQSHGYGHSIVTGRQLGDVGTQTVQADIVWRPSERFKARLIGDYAAHDNNGPVTEVLTTDPASPLFANTGPPSLIPLYNARTSFIVDDAHVLAPEFENRSASDTFFTQDIRGARLNLDWNIAEGLALKSLSSYREWDMDRYTDVDGAEFRMVEERMPRTHEQFQQELQLQGESLGGRLTWVLGGFYFASEYTEHRTRFLACELRPQCPGPLLTSVREVDSFATFMEATWALNDIFRLTGGVRFSREDIDDFGSDGAISGANSSRFEKTTPRASIQVQLSEDVMTYAGYSKGFRSGGNNNRVFPGLPNNGFLPYGPETLESYEIGLKSQFLERRLQLNLAVFKQDFADIQVETIPPGELSNFYLNAGEGKADGFEIEGVALIGNSLRLDAAVGYVDAGYTSLAPGVTEVTLDTPFADAPEWTYSVGAQWEHSPRFGGLLTTRVDWGWQDERQINASRDFAIPAAPYGLLRARVTYDDPAGRWSVAVFGTNLTEERYLLTGYAGAGQAIPTAQYGPPAEWGLTVSVTF